MKNISKIIIIFIFTITIIFMLNMSSIFSQKDPPIDVDKVLEELDEKLTPKGDFSGEITLIQQDPEKDTDVKTGRVFRKDKDNKFIFIFTSPKIDVGKGYLYIDDNLWFYDPNSREFTKKTMTENIGGSDSRTRDIEKSKLSENFDFTYAGKGKIKGIKCYLLKGIAKVDDIAYPKTKLWIRADNYLPVARKEYSISNRLAQTILYRYAKLTDDAGNEVYFPEITKITNEIEKGRETIVEFKNISLKTLPDNIFSKAYLENQNN